MADRAYQPIGAQHLYDHPKSAVWAAPGMGKTSMTLKALQALALTDDALPALVVGPLRVIRDTWPAQIKTWAPEFKSTVICGPLADKRRGLGAVNTSDITLVNFESVVWLWDQLRNRWPYKTLIIDEATRLRGFRGYLAQRKSGLVFYSNGGRQASTLARMSLSTKRVHELTGTPTGNSLLALWGQLWLLDQGRRLGQTFAAYRDRYFAPTKYFNGYKGGYKPLPGAEHEIFEKVSDICLALRAEDWFDLETPVFTKVEVNLPDKAWAAYREMMLTLQAALDRGEITADNAAAKVSKLLQIAAGSVYDENRAYHQVHTEKLDALGELIEDLSGEPVIVVYAWRHEAELVRKRFKDAVMLDEQDGFKAFIEGHAPIGLAHPASLGHGVDGLQHVCRAMIFLSRWYDAEARAQIIERIGPVRQMQTGNPKTVLIYDIVAKGTLDEDTLSIASERGALNAMAFEYLSRSTRRDHVRV